MRCVIMILTGGRGGAGVLLFCLAGDSLRLSVSITSPPPPSLSVVISSIYSMLNSCQAWVGTVGQFVRAWLYARPPAGSLQERGASAPS